MCAITLLYFLTVLQPEYTRELIDVNLLETNEMMRTVGYIWKQSEEKLVPGWDYEGWRKIIMNEFVRRISAIYQS